MLSWRSSDAHLVMSWLCTLAVAGVVVLRLGVMGPGRIDRRRPRRQTSVERALMEGWQRRGQVDRLKKEDGVW